MGHVSQLRRADAAPGLVLVIVSAGVVVASLDLFVVNVALPDMARDLGEPDIGVLSWVLNAYAIVYAALLVLFGRLADRYSREAGFLVGLAVFVAASAACAAATSVEMLVASRVLQAAGAALLTPTSLGLVLATSAPERRAGAVRAWTAVGGLAAALGPVVGGVLTTASWRWIFLINVPIGIAALVAGRRRLPHVPGHPGPRPDALGAGLVTAGVAGLTLGLVQGGEWGWGSTATVLTLALAAGLLAAFAARCLRDRNPLIDPALLRHRVFAGASAVAFLLSATFGAMLLSIALWQQDVWGWSALEAGLAIAPGPLMVPLFAFGVGGRLIARFGAGPVTAAGSAFFAAGTLWWAMSIGVQPDYAGAMLGGMLLTGVGVGLTLPTFMAAGAASLPPERFATGAAILNMFRQVGLAVGVAVLVAVVGSPEGSAETLDAFRDGWIVVAALAMAGGLAGAAWLGGRPPQPAVAAPAPAPVRA